MTIEIVGDIRAKLGECPVWSERNQALFWIDIDDHRVYRFEPGSNRHEHRELAVRPGSLFLTADPDTVLIAGEHDLQALRWSTGAVRHLAVIETASVSTRMNDGRCDRVGRIWVGTMEEEWATEEPHGRLFRIDPDMTVSVHEQQVGVSNGLAFSPDGATMYWADSQRGLVWSFDYDVESGRPSGRREFLNFADLPGKPDGACVDTDGCYWVACVYGSALVQVTPAGVINRSIGLPVAKPSMPAFGGPELRDLYVTSISSGGRTPAPVSAESGALLVLDVGAQGVAEPIAAISTTW